jgi:Subtilase family
MAMSVGRMTTTFVPTLADWSDTSSASAKTLDPLFYWAELNGFRGFLQSGNTLIRVAIQLKSPKGGAALVQAEKDLWLQIAPRYQADLRDEAKGRVFLTARVKVSKLAALAGLPYVQRIKPAFLAGQRPENPPELWLGDMTSEALRPSLVLGLQRAMTNGDSSTVKGWEQLRAIKPVAAPKGKSKQMDRPDTHAPLIGVIDFGCAFAHPHLQRLADEKKAATTRIAWLWDQGRSAERPLGHSSWPWQRPAELAYGREASAANLDALVRGVSAAALKTRHPENSVRAHIEQVSYLAAEMPELLDSWSHGTAVLGVAAAWPHTHSALNDQPDAAADADIVFVQLPKSAVDDQSGGWVSSYLLDGIEYILSKADGRPVVINIGVGSYAGSHDGASLLEAALSHYAKLPGVTLVLAAGNGAGRMGHAHAKIAKNTSAALRWVLPADDPTQSFLELWYEKPKDDLLPTFTLEHAAANPIECANAAAKPIVRSANQKQAVGAFVHVPFPNAQPRSGMALVALGPTMSVEPVAGSTATAPAGAWTITVKNTSKFPLNIHAYVERDEVGASHRPSRPDSILSASSDSAWEVTDQGTLTAQGTAKGVCTVGSYVLNSERSASKAPAIASSSSRGAARVGGRMDVDCLAPGAERIEGLDRGLVVLPNFSSPLRQPGSDSTAQAIRLEGTSLAAPWVTRQKYNELVTVRVISPGAPPLFPAVLKPARVPSLKEPQKTTPLTVPMR